MIWILTNDNFGAKLAAKLRAGSDSEEEQNQDTSDSDDDSDASSSDGSSSSEEEKRGAKPMKGLDTDVGFEWGVGESKTVQRTDADSSDEDSDSDDGDEGTNVTKSDSHKSRKKQAQRRREEQEISRRETALADGTADENPETAADFERLIAGDPNSSETWIRYMAFHLSLADIPSARSVAERAFERIEFRQEREKLNVWTALLALELKYGGPESLQKATDRACQQNNPKHVYLRVCEMMEQDASASSFSPETVSRTDQMFAKMCKKFKSKKKPWLANLQYLLKSGRHEEGQELLKRALTSLAPYKHVETMSKFAQLEFEHGSCERARTVFDGIIEKYPKRMDLLFVYVDKEIKHGEIERARSLLTKTVDGPGGKRVKLSDKQMKSLFKKWYRLEELHGTEKSQEAVKDAARAYVDRSSKK